MALAGLVAMVLADLHTAGLHQVALGALGLTSPTLVQLAVATTLPPWQRSSSRLRTNNRPRGGTYHRHGS